MNGPLNALADPQDWRQSRVIGFVSCDLPNDPALGVVNLHTGVVTHLNAPFVSPRFFAVSSGLLRVRWGQVMYAGLGLMRVGRGSLAAVR